MAEVILLAVLFGAVLPIIVIAGERPRTKEQAKPSKIQ